MSDLTEYFYFHDEGTRTIYWSEHMQDNQTDLIFLGSSFNPNKKMAVTVLLKAQNFPRQYGFKIRQYP